MENVLVIVDDLALPVGALRLKGQGSDGGHNGLKSIIARLPGEDFPRIKIGIGKKPTPEYDLADWVLSEFSKDDQEKLFACFEKAYDGLVKIVEGNVEAAMQICNVK